MPEYRLGFQISSDQKTLKISTYEDQRRLGYVIATAGEVEMIIQTLAERRQHMIPEVPRTLQDGPVPTGELDPIWAIRTHPKAPDKLLMIRHFGIGWLSFLLPSASAQKLANAL